MSAGRQWTGKRNQVAIRVAGDKVAHAIFLIGWSEANLGPPLLNLVVIAVNFVAEDGHHAAAKRTLPGMVSAQVQAKLSPVNACVRAELEIFLKTEHMRVKIQGRLQTLDLEDGGGGRDLHGRIIAARQGFPDALRF